MRPPQNAGEDRRLGRAVRREEAASMRPPQNAGEDAVPLPVSESTAEMLQ